MEFKTYSADFLAGHGYPVIILTNPFLRNNTKTVECHAFFSGQEGSYALFDISYDSENSEKLDEDAIMEAAKAEGIEYLYGYLKEQNGLQYQFALAGLGYKFTLVEDAFILQLHLRNFLSANVEEKIIRESNSRDLKSYIGLIKNFNRVTRQRKI